MTDIQTRIKALEDELARVCKKVFENYEYEEWPRNGLFWAVSGWGVYRPHYWSEDMVCNGYLQQGNCFRTREQAERYRNHLMAVAEWNKLAGSQNWVDWEDDSNKYHPSFNSTQNRYEVLHSICWKSFPYAHQKTKAACEAAIDKMGPEKMRSLFDGVIQ